MKASWPPNCDSCSEQLTEPGALVITPPTAAGYCRKLHLCVKCFRLRALDTMHGSYAAFEEGPLTRFNCQTCEHPFYEHVPNGLGCATFKEGNVRHGYR